MHYNIWFLLIIVFWFVAATILTCNTLLPNLSFKRNAYYYYYGDLAPSSSSLSVSTQENTTQSLVSSYVNNRTRRILKDFPRLCHTWRPMACTHLNETAKAMEVWRKRRRREACEVKKNDESVRVFLRGKHFRSWWGHVMPSIVESAESTCATRCVIRNTRLEDADVVVDTMAPGGAVPHPERQLWALLALENGGGGTHQLRYLNRTDILITWLRDSDVPINYMYAWQNLCAHQPEQDIESCMSPVPTRQELQQKRLAAAFVSNCAARDRTMFMRELFRYLKAAKRPVDSWGRCLHTPTLPDSEMHGISLDNVRSRARPAPGSGNDAQKGMRKIALLEAQYKFTLAFENTIRHDYVTEKALHPILASSIPVVWGAPKACDFLPGGPASCLNALDFESPQALGERMLELDRDDAAYLAYFDWRRDRGGAGPSPLFQSLQAHSFTQLGPESWPCRLCRHVASMRSSSSSVSCRG